MDPTIHKAPDVGTCPQCDPAPRPTPSVARDIGVGALMDPSTYVRGVLPAMTEEERWFRARPDHPFVPPPPGMKVQLCYEYKVQLGDEGAEICGRHESEHPPA